MECASDQHGASTEELGKAYMGGGEIQLVIVNKCFCSYITAIYPDKKSVLNSIGPKDLKIKFRTTA